MASRLKYPSIPFCVPGESMAQDLAMSGVNLADDRACILLLISFGHRGKHIDLGLDEAQDRARGLRGEWIPALPEAA